MSLDTEQKPSDSYSHKALKAASIVIFGYGFSQLLRLGGNLLLTRLLIPEYFGIMAICNILLQGIHLFSDIGLKPGVIRSKRSKEQKFLNTAWTLQLIRGAGLFLVSCAMAYPVALIYDEPQIAYLFPVLGISSLIQGFQSTSIITLNQELRQGRITLMEMAIQFVSLVITVLLAYLYRNIWALVVGNVFRMIIKTVWSHFLVGGPVNRFVWDISAVKEILFFGKWVFVATAMAFLGTQADRLILGKIFPLAFFGVYNIAVMFADLPKQVLLHLSDRVLFPLFTKYNDLPRPELRSRLLKQRRIVVYPLALLVAGFACFGDYIILLLYDQRYEQAAWMLPLLALGIWPLVLNTSISMSLYAIGKPNYSAFGNLAKFLYVVILIPLGYKLGGELGAVLAVVFNDIPMYIVISIGLGREKISVLRQDLLASLALVFCVMLFLTIRSLFGLDLPGMAVLTRFLQG